MGKRDDYDDGSHGAILACWERLTLYIRSSGGMRDSFVVLNVEVICGGVASTTNFY